jgi:hypothetical protein
VRRAPGPRLTLAGIAKRMAERGCARSLEAVSHFLNGRTTPPAEFFSAFAAVVRSPVGEVREAHRRTLAWGKSKRG